ncbi:MAG: Mut7-C RNAse domain-containing protein [Thermodesulfovibrio sp.]|nr:Mut7-C RNAse domain-containing protein [Thermodesulfovibrio sp.]
MIPKFVADVMLGSLSRWLRLFGFDTLYSNNFKDFELIKISLQEGRILLTKDRILAKSKLLKEVIFINSEHIDEQLKEVFLYLKDKKFDIKSNSHRCPVCNGEMREIAKEQIINEIPDYIAMTIDEFYICDSCGKIYWQGSHKEKIDEMREKILKSID